VSRRLTWAQDGYGRNFLHYSDELIVILCGLPGTSGMELKWLHEDYGP